MILAVQRKHHVQSLFEHISGQHKSIAFIVEEQDIHLPEILFIVDMRNGKQLLYKHNILHNYVNDEFINCGWK